MSVGRGWLFGSGPGAGEAVGVGAGFDNGAVEGEAVDDGCAETRVGGGLRPAAGVLAYVQSRVRMNVQCKETFEARASWFEMMER